MSFCSPLKLLTHSLCHISSNPLPREIATDQFIDICKTKVPEGTESANNHIPILYDFRECAAKILAEETMYV